MAEAIVLDIQIPTDDVKKAEQDIGRMRGQVEKLRAANKDLDKSSDAYTQNAIKIKRLNAEIRVNENVLVANTKAQKANEGSVKQLREQLKVASTEWANLSKNERENTAEGKRLTKQKKDLTDQLKSLEKATGDTRRNVGNYSEGMKEAIASSGLFESQSQTLIISQKVYQAAIGTSTLATRAFAAALAATGIGLVVGLIYSLREALQRTEEGQLKLNKVMATFSSAINAVFIALEPLANLIADYIIGYFDTLGTVIQGTFEVLEKTLRFLGQDNLADKLQNFSNSLTSTAIAAQKLADAELEMNKAMREQDKLQLRYQERAEKLRQIRDDDKKSIEERIAANNELAKILDEQSRKELDLAQKSIDVAKLRIQIQGETKDNLDALAQAELKVAEINERITSQRSEQLVNINSLLRDQTKITEEQAKAEIKRAETFAEGIEKANDEFLLQQKKLLLEGEISRDQYNQRLLEKEIELQEGLLAAARFTGEETLQFETELTDKQIALKELLAKVEKKKAAANQDLTVAQGETEFDVAKQGVDVVKQAAGENVAVNKAAALAQAGINIAQAITKVSAETGVLAPIFTAITAALGAVQTAKIRSTKVPAFADGVIGVDGPGTGTSDSIDAKISRGESVITAKATSYFAPELANMERAVGNRPNIQLGNKRFANGIIAAGNNPGLQSGRNAFNQQQRLVSDLRNMRMFLSLTELEERQTEFNQAKSKAEITELG